MRRILTLAALILANLTSPAFSQTPSIVIDGKFADWSGIAPLITDPEGDGPFNQSLQYFPGSDFRSVTLTHDATHLYILLEFAANHTGGITLRLDLDLDFITGCQGGELEIFVTESEPGGHLGLAETPNCWTRTAVPGGITSLPPHNVSRFLEAAIPLSALRNVTPDTYGFQFSGLAISPDPVGFLDYLTPALYFPGKTSTPRVLLQINESDPVVFAPDGRVRLTVDMPETTYTGNLSWYWVVVIDGQVSWITAHGISPTPVPFMVAPPVALKHIVLLDLVVPGESFASAFFLMDGDRFVAWDSVMAILDDPCCIVLDGDGLA